MPPNQTPLPSISLSVISPRHFTRINTGRQGNSTQTNAKKGVNYFPVSISVAHWFASQHRPFVVVCGGPATTPTLLFGNGFLALLLALEIEIPRGCSFGRPPGLEPGPGSDRNNTSPLAATRSKSLQVAEAASSSRPLHHVPKQGRELRRGLAVLWFRALELHAHEQRNTIGRQKGPPRGTSGAELP